MGGFYLHQFESKFETCLTGRVLVRFERTCPHNKLKLDLVTPQVRGNNEETKDCNRDSNKNALKLIEKQSIAMNTCLPN